MDGVKWFRFFFPSLVLKQKGAALISHSPLAWRSYFWETLNITSASTPLSYLEFVAYTQMRAADAKAAKTSTNLGTKFQQTQQMWSRPTRSMTQVLLLLLAHFVYKQHSGLPLSFFLLTKQLNLVPSTNGISKSSSTVAAHLPPQRSATAFLSPPEKEVEIIDAPIQGAEVYLSLLSSFGY